MLNLGLNNAAAEASTATANTAKLIQDNLWGRAAEGDLTNRAEKNKHLKEWQKFLGVLPHDNLTKEFEKSDELHGRDHDKHYFDHGEHGTGI